MSAMFNKYVTVALVIVALAGVSALAHEMTIKGAVAAAEAKRIQVKTGEEKKNESPEWYAIDAKTKIMRDKTKVTFEEAKIKAGERVVVLVNHDADGKMMALEIRLAAH